MNKYLSYGSNIDDEKKRELDYQLIDGSEYYCDALYLCDNSGYKYCKVTFCGTIVTEFQPD